MNSEDDCIRTCSKPFAIASWNLSAVNSNPFEYWVTHQDPNYNSLMMGVQNQIEAKERDLQINQIFTDGMFAELIFELHGQNISGLDDLQTYWAREFRLQMAIEDFLKNSSIGLKRLVSLPDRITNTINLADGGTCLRPTVINAYSSPLTSIDIWWRHWKEFMFHTFVQVRCLIQH